MPYSFYHNQNFILVDITSKNSVFCQFFSSSYSPKPILIQLSGTKAYSAHMDENGKLYVATMPDTSHLNYHVLENGRFTKHSLISNENSSYTLSDPIIYTLNRTPFIVYLSHQTNTKTYDFVCDNLIQPHLTTLLTISTQPTQIKYFVTTSGIYIFYITSDEMYHLNALYLTPQGTKHLTFINSIQPIEDYSLCIDEDLIHITYVAELHGKYQLLYYNTLAQSIIPLATTQLPSKPTVFYYYHTLWINALIDQKLHMYLSTDQGKTFSVPVPCSIQNNVRRCSFYTLNNHMLVAQELYAATTPTFKLCTISAIDLAHFHNDSIVPPELELLLEGLILRTTSTPTPIVPTPPPAPVYNTPPASLSLPSEETPRPTVENAKSAFMNQDLNSWDLPPRI